MIHPCRGDVAWPDDPAEDKSRVFFTKNISVGGLLNIYSKINQEMAGKIGIKIHTGGPQGPNILPREMVKALQQQIPNSNPVETNTLLEGQVSGPAHIPENLEEKC